MKTTTLLLDQGETMGGAERFLVDFCNDLTVGDKKRFNPKVVGGKTSKYREMLDSEIPIIPFAYPNLKGSKIFRPILVLGVIMAAIRLKKLVKTEQATVIYTNTPKTHLIVWMMANFFGKDKNVKWYSFIHDFTTPKWLLKSMGKHSDIIAVNSVGTREDTRKKMNSEDYSKIRIIENGVPVGELPAPQISSEVKNVLIIGRIDRRKGQNYALEAAKEIQNKYPDIHFYVVGAPFKEDPQTEEFYKELQDYAQNQGLKNVTFTGEIKNSFDAYLKCDLVLFTPIDPEPFGRVTIESLAMGKIVLAFNETGPREVIQQFDTFCRKQPDGLDLQVAERLLVKSCSTNDLVRSIEYFIVHSDHMKAISQYGRPFIESQYPLSETKKRLLQMLEGA